MNISSDRNTAYDEDGKRIKDIPSEDYVLWNEILPKPGKNIIDLRTNKMIYYPQKKGIDINSCSFIEAVNWLADKRIKKSQTSIMYVHRKLAVRFPTEYAQCKHKIDHRFRLEYELIQSEAKNDPAWFGETSIQNLVRLDGTLTNSKSKTIKLKNEKFRVDFVN